MLESITRDAERPTRFRADVLNDRLSSTAFLRNTFIESLYILMTQALGQCADMIVPENKFCVETSDGGILHSPGINGIRPIDVTARRLSEGTCGNFTELAETDSSGPNLETVVDSADECCKRCDELPLCTHFVKFSGACYLKSGPTSSLFANAGRSAYVKPAPASSEPPSPPSLPTGKDYCCSSEAARYCGDGICAFRTTSCVGIGCNLFGEPECRQCGQSILEDCPVVGGTDSECEGFFKDGKDTMMTILLEDRVEDDADFEWFSDCTEFGSDKDNCFVSFYSCEQYPQGVYARVNSTLESQFWCNLNHGCEAIAGTDNVTAYVVDTETQGEPFYESCVPDSTGDTCTIAAGAKFTNPTRIATARKMERLCQPFGANYFQMACVKEDVLRQEELAGNYYYSMRPICPTVVEPSFFEYMSGFNATEYGAGTVAMLVSGGADASPTAIRVPSRKWYWWAVRAYKSAYRVGKSVYLMFKSAG